LGQEAELKDGWGSKRPDFLGTRDAENPKQKERRKYIDFLVFEALGRGERTEGTFETREDVHSAYKKPFWGGDTPEKRALFRTFKVQEHPRKTVEKTSRPEGDDTRKGKITLQLRRSYLEPEGDSPIAAHKKGLQGVQSEPAPALGPVFATKVINSFKRGWLGQVIGSP